MIFYKGRKVVLRTVISGERENEKAGSIRAYIRTPDRSESRLFLAALEQHAMLRKLPVLFFSFN